MPRRGATEADPDNDDEQEDEDFETEWQEDWEGDWMELDGLDDLTDWLESEDDWGEGSYQETH